MKGVTHIIDFQLRKYVYGFLYRLWININYDFSSVKMKILKTFFIFLVLNKLNLTKRFSFNDFLSSILSFDLISGEKKLWWQRLVWNAKYILRVSWTREIKYFEIRTRIEIKFNDNPLNQYDIRIWNQIHWWIYRIYNYLTSVNDFNWNLEIKVKCAINPSFCFVYKTNYFSIILIMFLTT